MSEFKLPLPRRLLRCETLHHDDALIGRDRHDLSVFDEIASLETFEAPDLLLVIDELVDELMVVDELSISLTLLDQADQVEHVHERVAEVA